MQIGVGSMNIGVLALQGGVIEHINKIREVNENPVLVKTQDDLNRIDKLILPGGESTTIGKLLRVTNLLQPLKQKIEHGLPVWGTCAGMILLAKDIENDNRRHLEVMDIRVRRNGFGSQVDSFKMKKKIEDVSDNEIGLVFIRAPFVVETGNDVKILSEIDGKIIAVRQNNMVATSFHPELTESLEFYRYFIKDVI